MTDLSIPILGARVQLEGVETLDQATAKAKTAVAAFDTITASAAKTSAATKQLEADAMRAAVGMTSNTAAVNASKSAHDAGAVAVRKHGGAHSELAASVGLSRVQVAEFTHIGRSMVEMLAAGASPMRALQVEGARIAQAFSSNPGGVGGTFNALKSAIPSLVTGYAGLGGAVVAAGAGAVIAIDKWRSAQEELERSMGGLGRANGLSVGALNGIAESSHSLANGVSTPVARSMVAQYSSAGLDAQSIAAITPITAQYARVTGQNTEDAAGELAKGLADPTQGIGILTSKLGALDDATRQLITTQTRQLNLEGARKTLAGALAADLAQEPDARSSYQRKKEAVKASIGDFFDGIGETLNRRVFGPTPEDIVESARKHANDPGYSGLPGATMSFGEANKIVEAENTRRAAAKKEYDDRLTSLKAGDAVRDALPDIDRKMQLEAARKALFDVTTNSAAMDKLDATARSALPQAFDILDTRFKMFATQAQIVARDSEYATRSTLARNLADRALIETQRTYFDTIREGRQDLAAAQARARADEMISGGTKTLQDFSRTTNENHALMGLSSYDRNIAESRQQFDRMMRESSVTDGATNATVRFTTALERATAALDASGGAWANAMGITPIAGGASGSMSTLVAAIGQVENSGKLTGYSKMLGEDGRPSSAYGLGQITKGAEADIQTRLPAFSRFDPSQAQTGIATYLNILQSRYGSEDEAIRHYRGSRDPAVNDAYLAKVRATQAGMTGGTANPVTSSAIAANLAASASARSSQGTVEADKTTGQFSDSLKRANESMDARQATFDMQRQTLGETPERMIAMGRAQELLNTAYERGWVTSTKLADQSTDLQRALAGVIDREASLARQEQDRQREVAMGDLTRSSFKGAASTIIDDYESGKYAGQSHRFGRIMADVGQGIGHKLTDSGLDQISTGLFGPGGSPLGGLVGGSMSTGTATISATTVNLMGTINPTGSMLGGGGGGGILGMLGLGGGNGGTADDVAQDALQDAGLGFARGGHVTGPGTGTSDSIPARLSAGEFVVRAAAAARARPMLEALNAGHVHGYAEGGPVGAGFIPTGDGRGVQMAPTRAGGGAARRGGDVHIGGSTIVIQGNADKRTAEDIQARLDANNARIMDQMNKHLDRHLGDHSQAYSALKG